MHLIQILLPACQPSRASFPEDAHQRVHEELTERFGGLTAYLRSPATGLWKENEDSTVRDDIVIYEVMVERLERGWWQVYCQDLRQRFQQDEIIVRVTEIELL